MNDGINRGSSVYQRERDKALQRDDWECQTCGRAVGHVGDQDVPVAHVHHDTELSEGGVHHVDNLTTLCPECHGDIHGSEVGERDFNEQPYRNEEWLREMYHGEELTQAKIADRAGCHRRTIATWFRRHDITGRSADQRKRVSNSGPWDDEEVLRELYIEKRLTIAEVADQLGTSEGTVRRRMDDFGIGRRDHMEYMRQDRSFSGSTQVATFVLSRQSTAKRI
jgi:AraC-like DNA-binding protein